MIYGIPEWSSGFPHFLQLKSEFGNKEFMIWGTGSSQSYFCWLYRASPSLAVKNIINLISVLTIWWCLYVEWQSNNCVVWRGCLLWAVCSLGKLCKHLSCFILYSKAKVAHYSKYLLTTFFGIPVLYDEKDIFLLC